MKNTALVKKLSDLIGLISTTEQILTLDNWKSHMRGNGEIFKWTDDQGQEVLIEEIWDVVNVLSQLREFIQKDDCPQLFQVRDLYTNDIHYWTMKDVLEEINRDHSPDHGGDWSDYNESDWQEGWRVFAEGDVYSMIEPSMF